MGKPLEHSDMPPLTVEMHSDLRALEKRLRLALGSCCSGYDLIDSHAAFEYVRTYATEFYDCYYRFYSHIPDPKYRPHWRPASETFAFDRVVQCIENSYSVLGYFRSDAARVERIKRTIKDHAEQNSLPERFPTLPVGKRTSPWAAIGADIVADSPLLAMLMAAEHRVHPQSPRLSSQITSPSAARKMEAFMENKALNQTEFAIQAKTTDKTIRKFRQTGKVKRSILTGIASAMGITKEELLKE